MSPRPQSPDLDRLRNEGFFVQVKGGLLLIHDVPYVDGQRQVRRGTLISTLHMAGDRVLQPDTHVAYFDGEYPCTADGLPISAIRHQSAFVDHGHGVSSRHSFSSKPEGGYPNYYDKMVTYVAIVAGPARVVNPHAASSRTYAAPEDDDEDTPFNYFDTASTRAGIGALTQRLEGERIGILGLGGTGGYVLDLVAKTPAKEIRLLDGDYFVNHNAFRAPGAPSLEDLREAPKKVEHWKSIYSRMHRHITAFPEHIGAANLHLLEGLTFVFICMDKGEEKKAVIRHLEELGLSFVDVGMGLELTDGNLGGTVRVTTSTPDHREHVHDGRIAFSEDDGEDLYATNIQVADLNALNAALAVIKWKKLKGFYYDHTGEHHSSYTTDFNEISNGVKS